MASFLMCYAGLGTPISGEAQKGGPTGYEGKYGKEHVRGLFPQLIVKE